MTDKRGIVISTPMVAKRGALLIPALPLDAQELRYWLLFWDELNLPLLEGFVIDPGPDAKFLESVGVLKRHRIANWTIRMSGSPEEDVAEEQYQYHFLKAFLELDAVEPGTWSMATGPRSITLDEDKVGGGRGVLVRLHRALPVPDRDVPLDDVLTFKEKRRSELLALRYHLDIVYNRIADAPDGALAINSELTAVVTSLADYLKATRGSPVKRWIQTSFDAKLQLLPGASAAFAAYQAGCPPLEIMRAGATATLIVSLALGLKGFHRQAAVPWTYVSSYLDEIFPAQ